MQKKPLPNLTELLAKLAPRNESSNLLIPQKLYTPSAHTPLGDFANFVSFFVLASFLVLSLLTKKLDADLVEARASFDSVYTIYDGLRGLEAGIVALTNSTDFFKNFKMDKPKKSERAASLLKPLGSDVSLFSLTIEDNNFLLNVVSSSPTYLAEYFSSLIEQRDVKRVSLTSVDYSDYQKQYSASFKVTYE